MANDLAVREGEQLDSKTLLSVVSNGDCAALSPEQKVSYYRARCDAAGLDPRAQPFAFIKLQGKEVLYCLKGGTEQLAAKHGVVVEVVSQTTDSGIRTVTVRARTRDGRQTDEIGCVTVGSATGDALANVYMKAVTKAKRRAVLSICGLGMIDETELETIKNVDTPPSLPMPRRKGEKAPEAPKPAPAVIEAAAPAPEATTATVEEEPIVVPVRDNDEGEWVRVLEVSEKPTKKGGKSYGIKVQPNGDTDPFYVNTFSDTLVATARTAHEKGEEVEITRKPREWQGKTYWDLLTMEPAPF